MLAHQLDLFGGPPKPPKKIKVDDELPATELPAAEIPAVTEEAAPVIEEIPEEETITTPEAAGEWAPEYDEELTEREPDPWELESFTSETITSEEEPVTEEEVQTEEQPAVTEETFFAETQESFEEEIAEEEEPVESAPAETTIISKSKKNADEDALNIPADEELFKRQYYSMRETSAMFNVNQSLLRFWENEFDILQPKKNKKGDRYFRPVDIKNLELIYNLLRVRKFTLEGAKDYLSSHKKAADTFELVRRLEKLKSFLVELKSGL